MTIGFYGVDKRTRVTIAQIMCLERAIGYNLAHVKRRIFRVCRNYCDVGSLPDADWEALCSNGLAVRGKAFDRYFYKATMRGVDLIGMITGCRIIVEPGVWDGKELVGHGNDL